MPTPEARELEARDKVTKARRDCEVLAVLDGGALLVMQIRFDTAMDAYRTAVRAALVAEIVAGVENLGRRPVVLGEPYDNGTDDGWNDATHEVLTLIRATAHPTETDNGKL